LALRQALSRSKQWSLPSGAAAQRRSQKFNSFLPASTKYLAAVTRPFAQFAFNGEQAVVFGDAFGTAERASLDLASAGANGEISNE
jgi:hypothetical protein